MAGKGDKPRPTNQRVYKENYDLIDWTKKQTAQKTTKKVKNKVIFVY